LLIVCTTQIRDRDRLLGLPSGHAEFDLAVTARRSLRSLSSRILLPSRQLRSSNGLLDRGGGYRKSLFPCDPSGLKVSAIPSAIRLPPTSRPVTVSPRQSLSRKNQRFPRTTRARLSADHVTTKVTVPYFARNVIQSAELIAQSKAVLAESQSLRAQASLLRSESGAARWRVAKQRGMRRKDKPKSKP
jgi:hypothetical protein